MGHVLALVQIYRLLGRRGWRDMGKAMGFTESPQKMVILFRRIVRRLWGLVFVLGFNPRFPG